MFTPDRALERRILEGLATKYPNPLKHLERAFSDVSGEALVAEIKYLEEHRLLRGSWYAGSLVDAALTAAGVDFLADDGGLSAILGVVTVKLHSDTIKELLIGRVESSAADASTKSLLIKKIKALPASALEAVTMEGLKAAMTHLPDALGLLQKWLDR